jgi:hypothetical protein
MLHNFRSHRTCTKYTPCSLAAPDPETAACTSAQKAKRTEALQKVLTLLNIPAVQSSAVYGRLQGLLARDGAVTIGLSAPATGATAVANLIKPKLGALSSAVQKSARVSASAPRAKGRSVSVEFNVTGIDVVGKAFTLGPFLAFAVFEPCSSRIRSLYVNEAVDSAT